MPFQMQNLILTRTTLTARPADWHNKGKYCRITSVDCGCSVVDGTDGRASAQDEERSILVANKDKKKGDKKKKKDGKKKKKDKKKK
jgi:hypothetical protein